MYRLVPVAVSGTTGRLVLARINRVFEFIACTDLATSAGTECGGSVLLARGSVTFE